jgi:hypothetical protein
MRIHSPTTGTTIVSISLPVEAFLMYDDIAQVMCSSFEEMQLAVTTETVNLLYKSNITVEEVELLNNKRDTCIEEAFKTCCTTVKNMTKITIEDSPEMRCFKMGFAEKFISLIGGLFTWLTKKIQEIADLVSNGISWCKEKIQWCKEQLANAFAEIWTKLPTIRSKKQRTIINTA